MYGLKNVLKVENNDLYNHTSNLHGFPFNFNVKICYTQYFFFSKKTWQREKIFRLIKTFSLSSEENNSALNNEYDKSQHNHFLLLHTPQGLLID